MVLELNQKELFKRLLQLYLVSSGSVPVLLCWWNQNEPHTALRTSVHPSPHFILWSRMLCRDGTQGPSFMLAIWLLVRKDPDHSGRPGPLWSSFTSHCGKWSMSLKKMEFGKIALLSNYLALCPVKPSVLIMVYNVYDLIMWLYKYIENMFNGFINEGYHI